jgi:hypothetical protein
VCRSRGRRVAPALVSSAGGGGRSPSAPPTCTLSLSAPPSLLEPYRPRLAHFWTVETYLRPFDPARHQPEGSTRRDHGFLGCVDRLLSIAGSGLASPAAFSPGPSPVPLRLAGKRDAALWERLGFLTGWTNIALSPSPSQWPSSTLRAKCVVVPRAASRLGQPSLLVAGPARPEGSTRADASSLSRPYQSLIQRSYRDDVSPSQIERFLPLILDMEEENVSVTPCFTSEGINFMHIRISNLYSASPLLFV